MVARQDPDKSGSSAPRDCVCLTVELTWGISRPEAGAARQGDPGLVPTTETEFSLEVMNGRVVELIDWPPQRSRKGENPSGPTPSSTETRAMARGIWHLGKRPEGRVRARIEAPIEASLVVRGADEAVGIPILAVLERPQRTPPQSRLMVTLERLPWDSIVVDLGESARDGIVAPGATVPVSVGYNIIWPEASEVSVRTTAVLRPLLGGDVLWRDDPREVVAANMAEPQSRIWNVRAPRARNVRAGGAGHMGARGRPRWTALARLIRRRRPGAVANSAVRRLAFTVVDAEARVPAISLGGSAREIEVDSVDLSRARSRRPVATGRSPAAGPTRLEWGVPTEALIEPSRRDRVRGWFTRNGGEAAKLDAADAGGFAWTALGLKVMHPDRPHRLRLQINGGEPSVLGVAVVEPNGAGGGAASAPRLLLDACASGPPILQDGPPAAFDWVVFPRSAEVVLIMVNRSPEAEVRAGAITLTELVDSTPAALQAQAAQRGLGLYLTGPDALDRFGGGRGLFDPLRMAENLAKYLGSCGATAAVVPEDLADRASRRSLFGQADEDSTGPDRARDHPAHLPAAGLRALARAGFRGPYLAAGTAAGRFGRSARSGFGPSGQLWPPRWRRLSAAASRRSRSDEAAGDQCPGPDQSQ